MSTPRSLSFTPTQFRFCSREARQLITRLNCFIEPSEMGAALFLFESALYKHNTNALVNWTTGHEWHDVKNFLHHVAESKATRHDALTLNLLPHASAWDFLSTKFYTTDYSREEMVRQATILTTFSEDLIRRAVSECEPGKPSSYLIKILERMLSESVPTLRREEMLAMRVNTSHFIQFPEFRDPGFVARSIAEETFFHAI